MRLLKALGLYFRPRSDAAPKSYCAGWSRSGGRQAGVGSCAAFLSGSNDARAERRGLGGDSWLRLLKTQASTSGQIQHFLHIVGLKQGSYGFVPSPPSSCVSCIKPLRHPHTILNNPYDHLMATVGNRQMWTHGDSIYDHNINSRFNCGHTLRTKPYDWRLNFYFFQTYTEHQQQYTLILLSTVTFSVDTVVIHKTLFSSFFPVLALALAFPSLTFS